MASNARHLVVPRPPVLPKPSSRDGTRAIDPKANAVYPNLTVEPYNLSRPLLLQEVNDMVSSGLNHIEKERSMCMASGVADQRLLEEKWSNELLAVYRSAFRHYTESSTIYKPFLRNVLEEFEKYIQRLQESLTASSRYQSERQMLLTQHADAIRDVREQHSAEMEKQLKELSVASKKISAQEKHIIRLEGECEIARERLAKAQAEWEDMRVSCATLTNSLQRYSDASKQHKLSDAHYISEHAKLTISEAKSVNEAERLRLRNQVLEQENSLLVRHDLVEAKNNDIDNLKQSARQQEEQYLQLLQRYGLLKSSIERVYKQQQHATGGAADAMWSGSADAPEVLAEAIHSSGGDIRKVIEALLNHIHALGGRAPVSGDVSARAGKDTHASQTKALHAPDDSPITPDEWGGLLDEVLIQKKPNIMLEEVPTDHWPHGGYGQDAVGAVLDHSDGAAHSSTSTDPAAGHFPTQTAESAAASTAQSTGSALFDHFEGLGEHHDLPTFLRISGKVQNLFMTRKDTGRLIQAIMYAGRIRRDRLVNTLQELSSTHVPSGASVLSPGYTGNQLSLDKVQHLLAEPFSMFFESFLLKHFHTVAHVVQVAFNLLENAKKFINESDCRLFLLVLNNDLPQDVWYDHEDTFQAICAAMQKKELHTGVVVDGKRRLTVDEFMRTLRTSMPYKSELSFKKLQRALALENKSSRYVIDIPALLLEINEEKPSSGGTGARGLFCEMLRSQAITESIQFYAAVNDSIDNVCGNTKPGINIIAYNHQIQKGASNQAEEHEAAVSEATVNMLRKALVTVDPDKSRAEINECLARALGVTIEKMLLMEGRRERVPVEEFKRQLRAGLLKKSIPVA